MAHESGEGFVAVSGKTGFNNNSNIMMLFDSLVKAGFPKDHLTGNVKVIVGVKGHVLQQITERKGLIRTGKNADRPNSVLLVSKITELPAGVSGSGTAVAQQATTGSASTKAAAAAGGRANGAAAGSTAGAATGGAANDLDTELQGYLQTALLELPEGVSVIEKRTLSRSCSKKPPRTEKRQRTGTRL